jgi:hypothetical protein
MENVTQNLKTIASLFVLTHKEFLFPVLLLIIVEITFLINGLSSSLIMGL